MPYTQNWGISRNAFQSPLNDNSKRTIMEDPVEKEIPAFAIPKVDVSGENPKDIIEQNNERSNTQAASIAGSSFLTKQVIKEGIRNYAGPVIGKVAGVLGMFLTSQSAHARPPGEMIDGEYIKYSDFDNPKWGETSHGKRFSKEK